MFSKTQSSCLQGTDGILVSVEASLQKLSPLIQITGLPGDVVKESRERVRACLHGLGFDVPRQRILVHLQPAQAPKQGSQFDLAIAFAILGAEGFVPRERLLSLGFLGELGLDGHLGVLKNPIPLVEPLVHSPSIETVLVPLSSRWDLELLSHPKVRYVRHLMEAFDFVMGKIELPTPAVVKASPTKEETSAMDFGSIIGQRLAKRGTLIALAGRHHLLLSGSPGVGKTLLAGAARNLLPSLNREERIELTRIYGFAGLEFSNSEIPPFRTPHHGTSVAGLIGGGSRWVKPGEASLAHQGILFLDELPEFRRDAIEGLREPLESGVIHLRRIEKNLNLPARFQLIAAMNPCPCGMRFTPQCRCTHQETHTYQRKISGAILDRIDIFVQMSPPESPSSVSQREDSDSIRRKIQKVREVQGERERKGTLTLESQWKTLHSPTQDFLESKMKTQRLSLRGLNRLLRLGRTIADLEEHPEILPSDILEAWSLRCPDSFQK